MMPVDHTLPPEPAESDTERLGKIRERVTAVRVPWPGELSLLLRLIDERDATISAQAAELADLQQTFDLQWAADQRAIKQWQEAHPGNDMTWPDRCNMVVWLLDKFAAQAAEIERLAEINKGLCHDFNALLLRNSHMEDELARRAPDADADAMERACEIVPDGIITEAAQYLSTTRAAVEKKLQQDIAAALTAAETRAYERCAEIAKAVRNEAKLELGAAMINKDEIPMMVPSAEERLATARKAARDDWRMNGVYPKREIDTIAKHERLMVEQVFRDGFTLGNARAERMLAALL